MEMPRKKYVIQESGSITLPADFRKKYNLKPGDEISFVETEEGLLINAREALIDRLLDKIGDDLRAQDISLEELIESGRDLRDQLLKKHYDIDPEA